MRGMSATTRLMWSMEEIIAAREHRIRSRFHRIRIHAVLRTPRPIRLRRDFAGLDLAAAAPEDVGVADGDADGGEVFVDGFLVGEDALFFRAMRDAHDVDVAELAPRF